MKAVSGAALVVVSRIVQKDSFQARMMLSSSVEAMPGTAIGVSTCQISPQSGGAVHAGGLEDLAGDLAEVGVEHPDHDRQVDQHQHDREAEAGVDAGRA